MKRRNVSWMNEYVGRLVLGRWSQVHVERDHYRTRCGLIYPGRRYLQRKTDERQVTCGRCLQSLALGQGKGRRRKLKRDKPTERDEMDSQVARFFAGGGATRQLPNGPNGLRITARPINRADVEIDERVFLAAGDLEAMTAPGGQ